MNSQAESQLLTGTAGMRTDCDRQSEKCKKEKISILEFSNAACFPYVASNIPSLAKVIICRPAVTTLCWHVICRGHKQQAFHNGTNSKKSTMIYLVCDDSTIIYLVCVQIRMGYRLTRSIAVQCNLQTMDIDNLQTVDKIGRAHV